jgi:RNA polymerase sigma-70 factor (family 1)
MSAAKNIESVNEECPEVLFIDIYGSSKTMVFEYAFLLTQCRSLAEDIVQDVFVCMWMERKKIRTITNLKAYLYTITRNKVIDHMRRSQKEQYILKEIAWKKGEEARSTEEFLDQKEYKKILDTAISNLPPRQKMVFSLAKLYKWKRRKIADTMGISPATVRVHMNEAIKSIKTQVDQNTRWALELSEIINYKGN